MTTLTRKNSKYNTKRLAQASKNGDFEKVKCLIPFSDPKANESYALCWAARNGHIECVKLLIPFSDPKACNSEALLEAALFGYIDVVKFLIPVSDCKKVLERMQQDNQDTTLLEKYNNEYNITQQILQQKERLINTLKNKTIEAPSSIKRKM